MKKPYTFLPRSRFRTPCSHPVTRKRLQETGQAIVIRAWAFAIRAGHNSNGATTCGARVMGKSRLRKGCKIAGVVPEEPMDRSPPTRRPACNALVGLLTSEIGPAGLLVALPITPESCATMARRLEDRRSCPIQHSVTAAGAVPELHRVPCTSALPQERPTTNAQFKHPELYRRPMGLSSCPILLLNLFRISTFVFRMFFRFGGSRVTRPSLPTLTSWRWILDGYVAERQRGNPIDADEQLVLAPVHFLEIGDLPGGGGRR